MMVLYRSTAIRPLSTGNKRNAADLFFFETSDGETLTVSGPLTGSLLYKVTKLLCTLHFTPLTSATVTIIVHRERETDKKICSQPMKYIIYRHLAQYLISK